MKKAAAVFFAAVLMLFSVVPAFALVSPQESTYKYTVTIVPTEGGTGDYKFTSEIDENGDQGVTIEPIPYDGYTFDHWEIEGPYTTENDLTEGKIDLIITGDIICTPYYYKNDTTEVVTATVKTDTNSTSPKTGVADVLPYAVIVLSLGACAFAVFKLVRSK